MKRKTYKKVELIKVKRHLNKMLPQANDIDIKVEKNPNGEYESLIRVHIPPRKNLIAYKRDNNYLGSLRKSHQAMVRQIHKMKTRWHRDKQKLNDFSFAA